MTGTKKTIQEEWVGYANDLFNFVNRDLLTLLPEQSQEILRDPLMESSKTAFLCGADAVLSALRQGGTQADLHAEIESAAILGAAPIQRNPEPPKPIQFDLGPDNSGLRASFGVELDRVTWQRNCFAIAALLLLGAVLFSAWMLWEVTR